MAMIRTHDRGSEKIRSHSAAAGCGNLSEVAEPHEFASVHPRAYRDM
jgi:hypothetical protein